MDKQRVPITPLWIIAAFVTLTETTLGYAVTKTTGGIQVSLTIFVMLFAVIVASAFFYILWNRPYIFYSPSEYGNIDPGTFISAVSKSISPTIAQQVELVKMVEREPHNTNVQFDLINSLIDHVIRQHIILMADNKLEIPYSDMFSHPYRIAIKDKHYATGMFQPREFMQRLEGTKFVELSPHNGIKMRLTNEGEAFAQWLVQNNQRCDFVETPFGKWGDPKDFEFPEPGKKLKVAPESSHGEPSTPPNHRSPSAPVVGGC